MAEPQPSKRIPYPLGATTIQTSIHRHAFIINPITDFICAGTRLCPECGQIGHPLRECPFRNFYSPGQQKPSPTGQHRAYPTSAQIPVIKPISYAQKRLIALKKRQKVHQPRSRDFKPKSSPLAQYSEMSMPRENAVETTPAAESTPSKDTESPAQLLALGRGGNLSTDVGFHVLPIILRLTCLAREPGHQMVGHNHASVTIGADIPPLALSTVELRYTRTGQRDHDKSYHTLALLLRGPVAESNPSKPIYKKLSHNNCCGVHPPPISHFHLSLLFRLSSTITSRSHPISPKNTSINLSPSKSPFTTLYLLSIVTTASTMAPKRPCPACGQIGHPLRECPFRDFYTTGEDKVSMASSQNPIAQTPPISHALLGVPGHAKRHVSQPRLPTTQNPPMSYAYLCLKSRAKRQAHPLRSREFQKPGSSPLALSCETATDSGDVIDATPIGESTTSSNGTEESKPV
ncbi:unnamed protein product [Penicillium viridicatum]